jgi:hypothetical protein
MALLLERMDAINAHWQLLRGSLESVLPRGNGRVYIDREHSSSPTAALKCSNYADEIAERYGGLEVPVVPLLNSQNEEDAWFWLGWHEEWTAPNLGKTGKRLQFRSSAITVYIGLRGHVKRQLLRAEWAGPTEQIDHRYVFQADGAAHPHWHVDGIKSYIDDVSRAFDRLSQDREVARELARDRVRDFADEAAEEDITGLFEIPTVPLPSSGDLTWTEIHLAACARWAEQPWPGPEGPHDMHANNPATCEQIRFWVLSCVRYLQAQIEDKLLRARY